MTQKRARRDKNRVCGVGALALVCALAGLTGCDFWFPDAIVVSQTSYDFGLSELAWAFQVWTENPNVEQLTFTAEADKAWIRCMPGTGSSTGPDDKATVLVSIDRTRLPEGRFEGTVTVNGFGYRPKRIGIRVTSDGMALAREFEVKNVARNYTPPYLLDFTFSLRDSAGFPVIADPAQFDVVCLEDGVEVSPSETGVHLGRAADKQLKACLVLDYTASMADPANGDADGDGKSDAIEAMENAVKHVFLPALTADALVGVYEFHRDQAPQQVCDFSVDKQFVADCVDLIWDDFVQGFPGASRGWDAVYAAVSAFGQANQMDESRYVVFLSDGRDESSLRGPNEVIELAGQRGVRVYAVGFGAELDATSLQLITAQTHGAYYPAEQARHMPEVFGALVQDIEGQYTLRWATLKRGAHRFTPSFLIALSGYSGYHASPEEYVPDAYPGDTLQGALRFTPSESVTGTVLFLRAVYVPRYVSRLRFYLRSPYVFSAAKATLAEGGLCSSWFIETTEDPERGGVWIELTAPEPDALFGGLEYAAFGAILRLDFAQALAPQTQPFDWVYVDNSRYASGQRFYVEGWPNVAPE